MRRHSKNIGVVALAAALAASVAIAQQETTRAPSGQAPAQPAMTEKSVVTGTRLSDTDERRFSTATKMVFGREELDRYGDTSLGEVLKRLPGITIAGAKISGCFWTYHY